MSDVGANEEKNATNVFEKVYEKFGRDFTVRMSQELMEDAKREVSVKDFDLKRVLMDKYHLCKNQGTSP
jgi:predicted DNA binding CopG/RHH family protein